MAAVRLLIVALLFGSTLASAASLPLCVSVGVSASWTKAKTEDIPLSRQIYKVRWAVR